MGSKGRMPPPQHLRRPHPLGPVMLHHEPPGPVMHHGLPPGPFDLMPPPQVMEQKLASQHGEMQRLATENQRLAATHGVLRQELAGAQHELQMLHAHVGSLKADREQQMRGVIDKIAKMEAELKKAEPLKMELQQARGEAQNLVVARDELMAKAQHLNQEIQRVHADVQQIPALISELDRLRQEYQHCRSYYSMAPESRLHDTISTISHRFAACGGASGEAKVAVQSGSRSNRFFCILGHVVNVITVAAAMITGIVALVICIVVVTMATYDYEKKLYNDHLESLQVMEKNYVSMSREVEKLRAELTNTANIDRISGPYGGTSATNNNEASGLPVGQNAYEDGYAAAQGRGSQPTASGGGGSATTTAPAGAQPGPASAGTGYEAPRGGPGYIASAGPTYSTQSASTYDPQRSTGYDAFRGSAYDTMRGQMFDAQRTGYDPQRGMGYEAQRGPAYDPSRAAAGYDAQSRGVAGPQGQVPPMNIMQYGSTTPPTRNVGGGGYDAARGVNPARR